MKKRCWHRWKYRNPYDRRCKKCGKHQQVYGVLGTNMFDEWEDMVPSCINAPNPYV